MARLPHLLLGGLLALAALTAAPAQAQVVTLVNRPSWGPAAPASAQYYYLPEVGGYYDLRGRQYLVRRGGQWQRLSQLSGYNPTAWHPVVIDYVGNEPWSRHDEYRRRYPTSLPPGQRKRLESGKGLPPGQAKKYYGNRDERRTDDDRRRYEDRDQNRRDYDDDRDDDRDKKDKGKYKQKGKDHGKGKH